MSETYISFQDSTQMFHYSPHSFTMGLPFAQLCHVSVHN